MQGWWKNLLNAKEAATPEKEARPRWKHLKLLDRTRAIETHLMWQKRLRDVIQGQSQEYLDVPGVSTDEGCGLGKWIYNAGQANYAHLPAFEELRLKHAAFHQEAGQILEHTLEGRRPDAQRQLMGSFVQRTEELVAALEHLEEEAAEDYERAKVTKL